MSPKAHAVRVGLRRGWTEFVQSVRSPQDQGFYLFVGVAVLGYLLLRRNDTVGGTSLLYPSVAMPSMVGPDPDSSAIEDPQSSRASAIRSRSGRRWKVASSRSL